MDSTFDLLTLALLPGVHARTARDLAASGGIAEALESPAAHAGLLSGEAQNRLTTGEARRRAEAELDRAARLGARVVGWDDPDYPALLRRIYDPPPVLWVRGTLVAGEGSHSVAVVGARAATPAGRALAAQVARDLAARGATVVSGLARGIDTAAHEGALSGRGRTVAVLGSGLDRLYPPENAPLARAIEEKGGAVVTEFPPGLSARPGFFPRRNRIIAGWAKAVLVVQAAARSGALNTARTALDEGRDVLAVPGHPSDPSHEGTNQLLKDGAVLVRHAADVADELGLPAPAPSIAGDEDPLLDALAGPAPRGLDELRERTGLETGEILARLSLLELAARVRRLPGALFVRHT